MRKLSFALFASTSILAGIAIVEACGGTADDDGASPDAGVEAAPAMEAGPADAGAKDAAKEGGAPCDMTGYFLDDVPRDASLADGATTSGACLDCLQKDCKPTLDMCNTDCNCREVVSGALDCYAKGGDIVGCVLGSKVQPTQKTQGIGFSLVSCMQKSCNDECAVSSFLMDGGADGGDGGDGG